MTDTERPNLAQLVREFVTTGRLSDDSAAALDDHCGDVAAPAVDLDAPAEKASTSSRKT